jgi:hypothetical protein
MRLTVASVVLGLLLIGLTPRNAWGQTGAAVRYHLDMGTFEHGCFEICDCLRQVSKMSGTFDLRHLSDDPLYSNYAVESVSWEAPEASGQRVITGGGTYQVGGEVALQERMILDLSIDGGAPRRYDSGWVSGGGDFPRITIAMRIRQPPVCMDTLLSITASPGTLGIDPPIGGIPRMHPNPFADRTEVSFTLVRAGVADVDVLDLVGRRLRRLARAMPFGSGVQSIPWDGLDEAGRVVPAGLYRVRVRCEGRTVERTVAKLR